MLCGVSLDQPYDVLESLHLCSAYEDWLMGGPKASEMGDLLKEWESRAQALYPGWPVRSAVQAGDYDEAGYLAHFVCIGFLTASKSRDPEMHGSAMVLVWYQNKCPVEGVMLPIIAETEWRASAKDFLY